MKVITLPPQAAPKALTANLSIRTLQEHFLAFLNANNLSGFQSIDVSRVDAQTILGLLSIASDHPEVTEKELKRWAKRLRKASLGCISHSKALELLSALFGYTGWHEVRKALEAADYLKNRRTCFINLN